jgi:hypothetical protein
MRRLASLSAAVAMLVAGLLVGSVGLAQDVVSEGEVYQGEVPGESCSSCNSSGCNECGRDRGCRGGRCKGGRGKSYAGMDSHYNCGCNGSYNFPVPPLSTYHWPGMYKHQLMTDYHSPWRFPPIRPFIEEDTFQDDALLNDEPLLRGNGDDDSAFQTPSRLPVQMAGFRRVSGKKKVEMSDLLKAMYR